MGGRFTDIPITPSIREDCIAFVLPDKTGIIGMLVRPGVKARRLGKVRRLREAVQDGTGLCKSGTTGTRTMA